MSFKQLAQFVSAASDLRVATPEAASEFEILAKIFNDLDGEKTAAALKLLDDTLAQSASTGLRNEAATRMKVLHSIAKIGQSKPAVLKLVSETVKVFSDKQSADLILASETLSERVEKLREMRSQKEAETRKKRERSAQRVDEAVLRLRSVEATRESLTRVLDEVIKLRPALKAAEWKSLSKKLTGNPANSKREAEEEIAAWIRSSSHWEISHRSVEKAMAEGY